MSDRFTCPIMKLDDERRVAYGWASVIEEAGVPVEDQQGDVIKVGTLLDAAHRFVAEARVGKVMHKGKVVAKVVESVVLTKDLQRALGIDLGRVGWLIGMHVEDAEVWKRVKGGQLRAFSVGGSGQRVPLRSP